PGRSPSVVVPDYICGFYAALTALLGLIRGATRETIDLSMYESLVFHNAPALVQYLATGVAPVRRGNAEDGVFLQEVYRTGHERWVAVSIRDATVAAAVGRRLGAACEAAAIHTRLVELAAEGEAAILE